MREIKWSVYKIIDLYNVYERTIINNNYFRFNNLFVYCVLLVTNVIDITVFSFTYTHTHTHTHTQK